MTTAPPTKPDQRMKMLDAALKKCQFRQDALIEVLHKAQDLFGYLDDATLRHVARGLKLPPSRVYGVATFYHLFMLKPQGEHACVVCLGTACYVKGADRLLEKAEALAGCKAGETTRDGKLSVLTARCIGACGIAPAVVYDQATAGKQTVDDIATHLKGWLAHGSN
ncbi:MAG: bidirectional hydrogenase complex protein HoxE [Planctomycetota bacterium]